MKQENQKIIGVPADIASRISEYLKEISEITATIEVKLGDKLGSVQDFDNELLKTLQSLDFVRQATADSSRLMAGFSLSPIESMDSIVDRLHLEKTISMLKLDTEIEADSDSVSSESGEFHMF